MKKFLSVAAILMVAQMAFGAGLKIENLTWVRYGGTVNSNFALTSGGNFYLARQYVTLRPTISDNLSGRITIDFGVSGLAAVMKFAYLDWKLADQAIITFGLLPVNMGNMKYWSAPITVRNVVDLAGINSTADYGIALSGKIMPELGYSVQILNGEGYKTWTGADANIGGIATIDYTLAKMVNIGGSFKLAPAASAHTYAWDVYGKLIPTKELPLEVVVEYVGTYGSAMKTYFQAAIGYSIMPELMVMGMFNYFDTSSTAIALGANYKPIKGLAIKPYALYDLNTKKLTAELEMELSFAFDVQEFVPAPAATTGAK